MDDPFVRMPAPAALAPGSSGSDAVFEQAADARAVAGAEPWSAAPCAGFRIVDGSVPSLPQRH